jgi:hypothetical protein
MKKLIVLVAIFGIFTFSSEAQNLTKSEKKALKKEIKTLRKDPIQYQILKESNNKKELVINEQNYQISVLKKIGEQRDNDLSSAQNKIEDLKNQLSEATSTNNCGINAAGTNYRVQIGLFRKFDITDFLNNVKFIEYERVDGMIRYSLGNFQTEQEAENFKKELRKMGIKDAFVSEYKDGKRVK